MITCVEKNWCRDIIYPLTIFFFLAKWKNKKIMELELPVDVNFYDPENLLVSRIGKLFFKA